MICASCALFGNHRGHDISSEEDVLLMLTERANDIVKFIFKFILRC
jgi:hypothetical protein